MKTSSIAGLCLFVFSLATFAAVGLAGETVIDLFDVGPVSVSHDGTTIGSDFEIVIGLDPTKVLAGERFVSANSLVSGQTVSGAVRTPPEEARGVFEAYFSPYATGGVSVGYTEGDELLVLPVDLATEQNAFVVTFDIAPPVGASVTMIVNEDIEGPFIQQFFPPIVPIHGPGKYVFRYGDFIDELSPDTPDYTQISAVYLRIFNTTPQEAELFYRLSDFRTVFIPEPATGAMLISGMLMGWHLVRRTAVPIGPCRLDCVWKYDPEVLSKRG